jgi:CRISPR-associated protein Cas1
MSVVYIISDHGKLNKVNETLEFTGADGTIRKIFPHKLDCMIIAGVVSITGAAMRQLMRHQINTIFIASNGKYNGKLIFSETKNVLLRKKQFALSDDDQQALPIAKSIVLAKIKNELTFVHRIKRKDDMGTEFDSIIQSLKMTLNRAEKAESIAELRGHEGLAAKNYFSVFRHNLIPEWADFPRRSKNPPQTNVNAVLSFLYTLLMYRVETAIEVAGLDTMAGFLHATDYGKNALVFDIMEEFRTPVVDTLCCALFNLGTLSRDDFEEKTTDADGIVLDPEDAEISGSEKVVLLNKNGLNKVIPAFEKKMETLLSYALLDKQLPFNNIIIEQANHFKRVILGEEKEYKGFLYK